ncbi:MAG: AAA family ATPase, partial [Oscillospiraceae bacterium]|nr:AAA family ATPase [Oscillospiraceae bacterium]
MDYIQRHIEDIVIKTNSTFKGVLLTGARQTGKSTLLQELFPDKRYVPIDDPFIEAQANENPNEFMMLNPPPVIYDEVQRAPGLFRFIKIKCDESKERGLFCLSGSQPLELMEKASESLSGRVGILELSGLSL